MALPSSRGGRDQLSPRAQTHRTPPLRPSSQSIIAVVVSGLPADTAFDRGFLQDCLPYRFLLFFSSEFWREARSPASLWWMAGSPRSTSFCARKAAWSGWWTTPSEAALCAPRSDCSTPCRKSAKTSPARRSPSLDALYWPSRRCRSPSEPGSCREKRRFGRYRKRRKRDWGNWEKRDRTCCRRHGRGQKREETS